MKVKVTTLDSKAAGDITLADEVFAVEPRADIVARVVNWQLAKRRAGTHRVKSRGEIKATGAKIADLGGKMLRAMHVPTLVDEVRRHGIVSVELYNNQLGAEGGAALAKALDAMPSLATLMCVAA